ncbi:MAG: hypothetical protein Kow00133_14280 [Amphiplicatus sp.]
MRVWVLILFFLPVPPLGGAAAEMNLATRTAELQEDLNALVDASGDEADWNQYGAAYHAAYRRWFPNGIGASIGGADKHELSNLFRTYYNYLIASDHEQGSSELEAIFHVMETNGWADRRATEYMHRFYLTMRRFDSAEAFRRRHLEAKLPASPPILPSKIGDSTHVVLTPSRDGSGLLQEAIDLSASRVVIVGHPQCHFSQNAMADIEVDPDLAEALRARAVWIAEPFASLTDGVIEEWNRAHPDQQFHYAMTKDAWPEINYWGTPSFYFFKNGRLVKKVVGWPNDIAGRNERKAALKDGLAAIGAEL